MKNKYQYSSTGEVETSPFTVQGSCIFLTVSRGTPCHCGRGGIRYPPNSPRKTTEAIKQSHYLVRYKISAKESTLTAVRCSVGKGGGRIKKAILIPPAREWKFQNNGSPLMTTNWSEGFRHLKNARVWPTRRSNWWVKKLTEGRGRSPPPRWSAVTPRRLHGFLLSVAAWRGFGHHFTPTRCSLIHVFFVHLKTVRLSQTSVSEKYQVCRGATATSQLC